MASHSIKTCLCILISSLLHFPAQGQVAHTKKPVKPSITSPEPAQNNNSHHERGRTIYNYRCYFCHGYSGDAQTLSTTFLEPKPRDFSKLKPVQISRNAMIRTVTHGSVKTAMAGFDKILSSEEIEWVVDFIRREFMSEKKENTHYHTEKNGWPDHQRYLSAFPFANGDIPLDTPWNKLTPAQHQGKQLFLSSCISCHDRARVTEEGPIWQADAVSFPLNNKPFSTDIDSVTGASPFVKHRNQPVVLNLSQHELQGKKLYQSNCAFCHAADGTGKNWIGSFLQPPARDLTKIKMTSGKSHEQLYEIISNGLTGTTMPAWKTVLDKEEINTIIAYINRAFASHIPTS